MQPRSRIPFSLLTSTTVEVSGTGTTQLNITGAKDRRTSGHASGVMLLLGINEKLVLTSN